MPVNVPVPVPDGPQALAAWCRFLAAETDDELTVARDGISIPRHGFTALHSFVCESSDGLHIVRQKDATFTGCPREHVGVACTVERSGALRELFALVAPRLAFAPLQPPQELRRGVGRQKLTSLDRRECFPHFPLIVWMRLPELPRVRFHVTRLPHGGRSYLDTGALFEPSQASLDFTQAFGAARALLNGDSDEPIKAICHRAEALVQRPL